MDLIRKPIEILQKVLQDIFSLDQKLSMELAKAVSSIRKVEVKDVKTNDMLRITNNLDTISEVVMDWMVTLKLEN